MMRRRALLGMTGAVLPLASACAQVRAAAAPCPSRPGDIVGMTLEGTGAPASTVTVFGQAFRPGDLPAGARLAARLADGTALPTQLDVRNRHPDRSVRHAVVSLAAPALSGGARAGVILSAVPDASPIGEVSAVGRQAAVTITPLAGGTPWEADLLAAFVAAPVESRWQSGPLATQTRLVIPVPASAVGGVASLRLVADVAVRADGTLWLDAWFRNDVAMRPNGGEAAYAARILLDGRQVLSARIARHFQYTAWGRVLGATRAGPAPEPSRARHDANYLADAAAVARYDVTTGVDEAVLARMAATMAAPTWNAPFSPRGITQDMGTTGGRADIGPATAPQAAWLITGDARAAALAVGQAEAAGAIPWHYWDPSGGTGAGGWLDTRRWPRIWSDGRGGPAPGGLMQPIAADTGWACDAAHQPDLSTVPYLLTGRRAFLDHLCAQASWCVVGQWPGARGITGTAGIAEGVNVVRGNQVRGAAWSLRQLGNAAWAAPESDTNLPWFRAAAAANWAWTRAQIPAWTTRQGEAHGWIPGEYGSPGVLPPWQQDYFASTAAIAARRGNDDARAVLAWMSNFLVGRFVSAERGFNPRDGAAYLIAHLSPSGEPLRRWSEIGDATRGRGLSNGSGWSKSNGDYAQLAAATLAVVSDTLGPAEERRARSWLLSAGPPFVGRADLARDPQFNIVPRSAPTCAVGRGS